MDGRMDKLKAICPFTFFKDGGIKTPEYETTKYSNYTISNKWTYILSMFVSVLQCTKFQILNGLLTMTIKNLTPTFQVIDCWLVWFFTSQSTAMVMSTVSSPYFTFFWASFTKWLTSTSCTYFRLLLTTALLESAEGRRMTVEIISRSISTNYGTELGSNL